jgi:hypothetical protein
MALEIQFSLISSKDIYGCPQTEVIRINVHLKTSIHTQVVQAVCNLVGLYDVGRYI